MSSRMGGRGRARSTELPFFDNLDAARREYMRLSDKNEKLRKLVQSVLVLQHDPVYKWLDATMTEIYGKSFTEQARELGVE